MNDLRAPAFERAVTVAALFVVYVLWGSTYLAGRIAVPALPPLLLVAARCIPAGALLWILGFLTTRKHGRQPAPFRWSGALIAGTLLFVGGQGGLMAALQSVPSGASAVVFATTPGWILLLDRLRSRGGDGFGPRAIVGLLLGLAGVALLAWPSEIAFGGRIGAGGALLLVGGTVAWAVGTIYMRDAGLVTRNLRGPAMHLLAGGAVALLLGLLRGEAANVSAAVLSSEVLLSVVYLAVVGSMLGVASFNWLLGRVPAARLTAYTYVNPVVAVLIGWAFGGESLSGRMIVATVITLTGVALIVLRPSSRGRAHASETGASDDREDLARTHPRRTRTCLRGVRP